MTDTAPRTFSEPDVPSFDIIRSCVHCGFCLPTCPTYRLTSRERSSPRGRIWLMKAVTEGRMDLMDPIFDYEMSFCLNCRACEAVCPSGVEYGKILEASRAQLERASNGGGVKERAAKALTFGFLFKDMRRLRAASHGLKLYQRTGVQSAVRKSGVLRLLGLAEQEAMLPRASDEFLVPQGQTWPAQGPARGRVALFTGCIMSTAYAEVHMATVRVLTRNGYDVTAVNDQTCCGALHVHGGDMDGGRELARRNIDSFDLDRYDAVIINAAGCGAALKEYDHLLHGDPEYAERARQFSAKVRDITEFLVEAELREAPGSLPMRVTYQDPCHLAHAQRISAQPRQLLEAIPDLEVVEMPEAALCCGSAGVYNVIHPQAASELGNRKVDNALSVSPEVIVSANPGCMLQIQGILRNRGLDVEVLHIVELLDRAYQAGETAHEPAASGHDSP
jgi:glycolate oxidase iron-sulfur subunit